MAIWNMEVQAIVVFDRKQESTAFLSRFQGFSGGLRLYHYNYWWNPWNFTLPMNSLEL